MRGILFSIVFFFTALQVEARDLTLSEKISDFQQLTGRIRAAYGPLDHKRELGIDIDQLVPYYLERIASSRSNGEFYYLLNQFIAEFQDSHFTGQVQTNHRAMIPIAFDRIEGRVLVDNLLPGFPLPLRAKISRGDELISIDGVPAEEAVRRLTRYQGQGYAESRLRFATFYLGLRVGTIMPVPSGRVDLVLRKRDSEETVEIALNWAESGTPLDETIPQGNKALAGSFPMAGYMDDFDLLSLHETLEARFGGQAGLFDMCSPKSMFSMPKGAVVVTEEPALVYYHPTDKGNIGYIRLPHYLPRDSAGNYNEDVAFAQMEYAVHTLQRETVGLVIDQTHNCGGSVSYLHRLVSLFIERPIPTTRFSLLGSKENYLRYHGISQRLPQNTLIRHQIEQITEMIDTAWTQRSRLTDHISLVGADTIYPHSVRYTHPILILIDELSGSGGDAFPALLQGYDRAVLMGKRTMGAGGNVVMEQPLSFSQHRFAMTHSMFYRPDGTAVENNGAEPDIFYAPTIEDFMNQYTPYRELYTQTILEMID